MQNRYLEILELQPGATKSDIRAAYRRLSKKYHPDISHDNYAKERFIEISEAYKFLTRAGSRPRRQKASSDYNAHSREWELWRLQAREYAQWKAKEAERKQSELVKNMLLVFNQTIWAILVFNLLLAADYLLPLREVEQHIMQVVPVYETERYLNEEDYYRYDEVYFSDYRMRVDAKAFKYDPLNPEGVIFSTTLFQKPLFFKAETQGKAVTCFHAHDVYFLCGFIIPLMLAGLVAYRFTIRSLDPQLTLAIITLFVFAFQVFIFFSF